MRIYVPSRGRASWAFMKGAYTVMRWLTPALKKQTVFCVRSDEVERYRQLLDDDIEVFDCGMPKNLSEKRDIIARRVALLGEKKFLMCDDDVMLYIRKSATAFNLRYPCASECEYLISRIEDFLNEYPMVGVSSREGNNRAGIGPFPMIQECTRSMRMYAFRTDDYLSIKPNRMSEMADFDTTLQFLRKGQKNAVMFYWAQGQPGSQHPGGCSAYRTSATHHIACLKLLEYHPDFVSIRQKQNKGDQHGFGTRTEVTVQWKKAYDHANRST